MRIETEVSLSEWTWWKIGGPADHFCRPRDVSEVREALRFAADKKLPVTVLGGGTNVLVSDEGVEGLVLCTRDLRGTEIRECDGRIQIAAVAGTPKSELTKEFLRRRLAPALFLCGLPGDVGGGVAMNAGVGEAIRPREFVEITDWVEVVPISGGEPRRFAKADLEWTYRASRGWQPGVITRAGFSWELTADDSLPAKVKEATKNRIQRQPLELPSCGSTFKNPEGHKAGALIEQAGLKGFQIRQAQVSTKHANFIVNLGGAKARDVDQIIRHVRDEVFKRSGVRLETEVKYLGRWSGER